VLYSTATPLACLSPGGVGADTVAGQKVATDGGNEGEEVREVGPHDGEAGSREDGRRSADVAASSSRREAQCMAAAWAWRGATTEMTKDGSSKGRRKSRYAAAVASSMMRHRAPTKEKQRASTRRARAEEQAAEKQRRRP
jgi:hypothetical protein